MTDILVGLVAVLAVAIQVTVIVVFCIIGYGVFQVARLAKAEADKLRKKR